MMIRWLAMVTQMRLTLGEYSSVCPESIVLHINWIVFSRIGTASVNFLGTVRAIVSITWGRTFPIPLVCLNLGKES